MKGWTYVQAISSQPRISWMHVQPNFIIHGILLRAFRARGSFDKTDKMLRFNDRLKLVLITSPSLLFSFYLANSLLRLAVDGKVVMCVYPPSFISKRGQFSRF